MSQIPNSLKSTWRVVQVLKIIEGLFSGLILYISTPYVYQSFQNTGIGDERALFYAAFTVAFYFGMIALLEIPTGAIADTFGRVKSIIISQAMSIVYSILFVSFYFIHNFYLLLFVAVITRFLFAVSFTLNSGSFSAWLVDTMREREPGFSFERLLARGESISSFSSIVGAALGITFYLYGVAYIAYVVITLLSLGSLSYCLLSMEESSSLTFYKWEGRLFGLMCRHTIKTIKMAVQICYETKVILWHIILYTSYSSLVCVVNRLWPVAFGAQFGIHTWSWQWYLLILLLPLCAGLTEKILAHSGDRKAQKGIITSNHTFDVWLFVSILLCVFFVFCLGFANHIGIINFPVFVITILVVETSFSIVGTVFQTLVCRHLPEKYAQERATVLSIVSGLMCFFVLISIVPARGTTDALSPVGWILPAAVVLVVTLVAQYFIRKYSNVNCENLKQQPKLEVCDEGGTAN